MSCAQTELAVAWSTTEPRKMIRSFNRRWKISALGSATPLAALTSGGTKGLSMATRLPGPGGLSGPSGRPPPVPTPESPTPESEEGPPLDSPLPTRRGRGGTGRRAGFRSRSPPGDGGSSPLARTRGRERPGRAPSPSPAAHRSASNPVNARVGPAAGTVELGGDTGAGGGPLAASGPSTASNALAIWAYPVALGCTLTVTGPPARQTTVSQAHATATASGTVP